MIFQPLPEQPGRLQENGHPTNLAGIWDFKLSDSGRAFDRKVLDRRVAVLWETQARAQRLGFYVDVQQGEDRIVAVALQSCKLALGQNGGVGKIAIQRHPRDSRGVPEDLRDDRNPVAGGEMNCRKDSLEPGHRRSPSRKWTQSKASRAT